MDGGASSKDGLLEKDINLSVALCLKEIAEQDGKTVIMTRSSDTSLHTTDSKKIRSQKRSDLEIRKKIMQENSSGIFVSIHMNKFEQTKYKGAQVFYADNAQSRALGEKIQASLISGINDGNNRVSKPVPKEVFIFKDATCPAVVVECGFLSNPEEAQLLSQPEYRQKLATCIYQGVKEYSIK